MGEMGCLGGEIKHLQSWQSHLEQWLELDSFLHHA